MSVDVDGQMRAAIRDFAGDVDGVSRVRAEADLRAAGTPPADDRAVWHRLCDELGVSALVVPEKRGGLGAGEAGAAIVLEELGYRLEPAPVWSSLNAARALSVVDGTDDLLDGLLAGDLVGTLALPAAAPDADPDVRCGPDGSLEGTARCVPDGAQADVFVVLAGSDHGPVLAVVHGQDIAPERRRTLRGTDLVRTYADVDLTGVRARVVVDDPEQVRRCRDLADLSLAFELLGGTRACLDRTVDYLKVREQFGRVIGGFQALQHQIAALAVRIEQVDAVCAVATRAADEDDASTLHHLAPLARATSAETFVLGADLLIHLHGGIGFTWEHDAHLFFRRARGAATWGGTPGAYFRESAGRGAVDVMSTA